MKLPHQIKQGLKSCLSFQHRQLTPLFGWSFRTLPFAIKKPLVEHVVNHVFAMQLEDNELDFLEHRVLEIDVLDFNVQLQFTLQNNQLVCNDQAKVACLTIRGTSSSFILLANREEDPDTLFFQRRLTIEGDTELGLYLKNLMDSVDLEALPMAFRRGLQAVSRVNKLVTA